MTIYTQRQHESRYPRNWDDQSGQRRTYSTNGYGRQRFSSVGSSSMSGGYDTIDNGPTSFPGATRVVGAWKKRTNSYASSSSAIPVSTSSTAAPSSPSKSQLLLTDSPPLTASTTVGLLPTPQLVTGVFVNDCPPSPRLTKSLLGHAQSRKRAGRHSLISIKDELSGKTSHRILRLSPATNLAATTAVHRNSLSAPAALTSVGAIPPIDRQCIPEDLYDSLIAAASIAKKSGQHKLQRRRFGLSGEVETLLVRSSSRALAANHRSTSNTYSSIFSPDPSLFNFS